MRSTYRRRRRLSAACVLAVAITCAVAGSAAAQTQPRVVSLGTERPTSAIYIGNSFFYYNNGLSGHVSALLRAADPAARFRATSVTISGSGFDWHDVESYFRPNGLGRYSFDADNRVVFNTLGDRLFDLAILMDCSQCPLHPQLKSVFREYAKKHAETVRRHGATPVFFMSWAYADVPSMTAALAEEYTRAANANDALVIPAGLAFANSVRQRPGLNLYVEDQRHPSLAGTYLAACTTYATLFGRSPVGLSYTAGLDAASAAFLQRTAWDTVQEYLRESRTQR